MKASKNYNRHKRRRLWIIPTAALGITVLAIIVIGQFTPVVNALIIRKLSAFQSQNHGPNFAIIQQNVRVVPDIVYGNQGIDNSIMDIYYPTKGKGSLPVVLWIHGGGFVLGDKEVTKEYAMTLANQGYVVANINYALAPEHKYPTPIIQVNQALQFLKGNVAKYGGDIDRLFIGGNSAGAQMASQIAAMISNSQFSSSMGITPAVSRNELHGVILFCGMYDMDTLKLAGTTFAGASMETFMWSYTGVRDYQNYSKADEISTVKHVTSNYPAAFVSVGDADPLQPQSIELLKVIRSHGVDVDAVLFNGTNANLGHDYQYDLSTHYAQQSLSKVIHFLSAHDTQVQN